ncbi:B3/4 domain-containing protein [Vibrio gazogenes]|uniref:B3/B4 domain-containing protein (DNA/RNA-binding domain of Phe-tRNA-synthetase) n=1 Tax=Vibrio gazogenes DSM 21264 = NBRC 103151 TaxID=1123492 RepID=A0A1M4UPC9_VIBGA|nr:B3/4 domain-containing protein [Vibrio gazogenes]USP15717.1 B3/4 domain-containing protein [Vibrio gazogenes]SHE58534.1 B3/B4 domain-containing protein (DNA/RNA-binding domain of Phe-tRNA-synthetase) [Vibrio gazogenes DSM 21264] [Vibrio gazogenes DSM 21264 = NBRC 103151]SJN57693.1 B3/4 domain protein [Vibrio gazogenes]
MVVIVPSIDDRIYHIAPKFRALSISVQGTPIQNPEYAKQVLQAACTFVIESDYAWAESHIDAWGDVFRQFGSKPNRTPCSAAALRKRVLKNGGMESIDPIVDIYNAISIQYALPVGGENIDAYQGTPTLTIADGTERFDTMKDGSPTTESPNAGEVIWRDAIGVTCRRWNWRQGLRTRIESDTRNMWFILESLPEMPLESLQQAGQDMVKHLRILMPDAIIEQTSV